MNYLNHFLNNRLKIKKESKYSLIIGETPSKGARSPKLWNRVYKAQKSSIRMYPADVSKNNIGFDSDFNEVTIYYKAQNKKERISFKKKSEISEEIVDRIVTQLN